MVALAVATLLGILVLLGLGSVFVAAQLKAIVSGLEPLPFGLSRQG